MNRTICLLTGILLLVSVVKGQQKKYLTQEDYGKWQSIGAADLSPDGNWLAYQITVQEDNDTLYVNNRSTGKAYKLEFAGNPEFSRDNQWIAYRIGLPFKDAEKLRDQSKPIESKMGLLNLATGKKEVVQNINHFGFSRNGKYLAVYLAPARESRDRGSVLLVKNLQDGTTRTIGNVTEFSFNKKSDYLAYIIEAANSAGNTVELYNLSTNTIKVIASDTTKFSRLNWQKEGDGLAFYRSYRKDGFEEDNAMVYTYTNLYKTPALKVLDPQTAKGFPAGMRIYTGSALTLSNDMTTVFFGLKTWTANPLAKKEDKKPGDSLTKKDSIRIDSTRALAKKGPVDKLAPVDVWHWKDPEIQPRQRITYSQDTISSFLSAWNLDNNAFFRLAKELTPNAVINGNQKWVLIYTDKKYRPSFKEDYADAYLVNVKTGEEKLVFEKAMQGFFNFPQSSPDGKYFVYFKDKNWWSYNVATGKNTNLTEGVKTAFWDVRDDHPASRPAVGGGGWLKNDKELLLYDEYNVWAVNPDGSGARKLTDGEKDETVFRVTRLDTEDPFIDDSKPIFLTAYGDKTKKFGYYRMNKGKVEKLVWEDLQVNRLVKAKDANAFLYVKQDYNKSPALYASNDFKDEKLVAETNLQQKDYYWGKSELIGFTNKKGKKLQGALFYPANYEPGKKYPMIVYIYEILSNSVHGYVTPSRRSPYNTTNFTSNGYFVFRPDIVYEINDPGMSAANCVIPAVEEVVKTGMIDKDRIGIMGHSWGAYQTSFIITQTDLFKAAIAGAPLTNMISMSNSIYWNTGTPDSKIFETSQGRFDGPWYERMEDHIRNSPMFNAAKINTPLLVTFGDKDGAVDWHQGIEMYSTMRRMQKPMILLVYADENHGFTKKEDQIDYQRRQKEFFDYYLLGKPGEKWITEGVPYQDKMHQREKEMAQKAGM
ncbi:MAG: S9 family peptidase [Williamsia sp.]|nr:S9 family peptidase [Williamsia sp.]